MTHTKGLSRCTIPILATHITGQGGYAEPLTPEQQHQAFLSRLLLMLGSFVIMCLLLVIWVYVCDIFTMHVHDACSRCMFTMLLHQHTASSHTVLRHHLVYPCHYFLLDDAPRCSTTVVLQQWCRCCMACFFLSHVFFSVSMFFSSTSPLACVFTNSSLFVLAPPHVSIAHTSACTIHGVVFLIIVFPAVCC